MMSMGDIQRHYDDLLATHYSWMSGMGFAHKVTEQRDLLNSLGFPTETMGLAVDLGCGPGYQALALEQIGYQAVLAIDTSRSLLDELDHHKGDRPIRTELADMRDFTRFIEVGSVDAIICMGDTLPHLDERSGVSGLLRDAYASLRPGGKLALTFSDFSVETIGRDRFIPVRADDERVMICALEYDGDKVIVSDLIHIRTRDGWTLHKSSYRKLRLEPARIVSELKDLGFLVEHDGPASRMHAIVARKP
jgi:SAM-dependent methyltransferase